LCLHQPHDCILDGDAFESLAQTVVV
jgi:hypothetical protein